MDYVRKFVIYIFLYNCKKCRCCADDGEFSDDDYIDSDYEDTITLVCVMISFCATYTSSCKKDSHV